MPELGLCPGAPLSQEQVPKNRLLPWVDSTHLHVPLGPHTWTLENWCVSQALLGHHTNSDSCFLMARTFQEHEGHVKVHQAYRSEMWHFPTFTVPVDLCSRGGAVKKTNPPQTKMILEVSELSGAFPKRGSLLTLYDPRAALIKTLFFLVIYLTRSSSKIRMGLKPEVPKQNFIQPSHLYLRSPLGRCGWPQEAPNKHFWHGYLKHFSMRQEEGS